MCLTRFLFFFVENQPQLKIEEEIASRMILSSESCNSRQYDIVEYRSWWILCVEEINVALLMLHICSRGVLLSKFWMQSSS